jgi:hypothetical protein
MTRNDEHQHVCWRCGHSWACFCSEPVPESPEDRMCPLCAEEHRRIRDAPRSYSTKLKYSGAQRRWRR